MLDKTPMRSLYKPNLHQRDPTCNVKYVKVSAFQVRVVGTRCTYPHPPATWSPFLQHFGRAGLDVLLWCDGVVITVVCSYNMEELICHMCAPEASCVLHYAAKKG